MKKFLTRLTRSLCTSLSILLLLSSTATAEKLVDVFTDDFSSDTSNTYTWSEVGYGDLNPDNNYSYDPTTKTLRLSLADNVNIYLDKELPKAIQAGRIQFDFDPTRTFPFDGICYLTAYGTNGNLYHFAFSHNAYKGSAYQTQLRKLVDGQYVVNDRFIPNPNGYSLNEWHTMTLDFTPESFTGTIDGVVIRTENDPTAAPIEITAIQIGFAQQDEYVDNIKVAELITAIDATIDIDPDSLNLSSKGKFVTCYIELKDNQAQAIDAGSVKIEGMLDAISAPTQVGDHDFDGNLDLMVKFDRAQLIDLIREAGSSDTIELTVTGALTDGLEFIGNDTIRVIK